MDVPEQQGPATWKVWTGIILVSAVIIGGIVWINDYNYKRSDLYKSRQKISENLENWESFQDGVDRKSGKLVEYEVEREDGSKETITIRKK